MLDAICAQRSWPVISREIQPDHIHLFVSIPPAIVVADAVKVLKGRASRLAVSCSSSRRCRNGCGADTCVSPSYYVGTAGNVSDETIRRYIERSEHVTKRR